MTTRIPVLFSWSGGKDSALALYELSRRPEWQVVGLLTTVADEYGRVSHHGVRESLLDAQAELLGLPLDKARIPTSGGPCTNGDYEALMAEKLAPYVARGVLHVAHGDLFLADVREYRQRNLARLGMSGVFPLWGHDTRRLMDRFDELGFRAVVCCVDGAKLDGAFVGRELNGQFVRDLPPEVDPCGENGEYHSLVYDGPIFRQRLSIRRGEVVCRDNRHYIDLWHGEEPDGSLTPAAGIPPV